MKSTLPCIAAQEHQAKALCFVPQVAASQPSEPPVPAQLGLQPPAVLPAAGPEAAQEPGMDQTDWAQFINLDADGDEDEQPRAQQGNGAAGQVTLRTLSVSP